jgi:hypothetical protein
MTANRTIARARVSLLVAAGLAFCLCAASACSSSDGATTGTEAEGGAGTNPDGGPTSNPSDGSAVGDGAGQGDDGAATSAIVISGSAKSKSGGITALINPHSADGASCTRTVSGPCVLLDCSNLDADATTVESNAGPITVSGGMLAGPQTLMFSADDQDYRVVIVHSAPFSTGQTFTVNAPGQDFPAFSGTSAPAPGVVTITSPAPVVTDAIGQPVYHIDPTKPFTLSWSGGTPGSSVLVSVDTVSCKFDAAAGMGTIPADMVARIASATTTVPNPLVVLSQSSAPIASGLAFLVETGATNDGAYATQ